jgi:pentatricopeptide repeat protein
LFHFCFIFVSFLFHFCFIPAAQVAYTTLMDAYGRGSEWEAAERVLEDMQKAGMEPNVVTYTTLVNILGKHGQWHRAEKVGALSLWTHISNL